MATSDQSHVKYRFGPFELDPLGAKLQRDGVRIKLQDLPFRLLVLLVERSGEIVTREEVREHLWPEDTFVGFDNSLGVAVRKVRDALNDHAEAALYVETIPRRGYRFIAPVERSNHTAIRNAGPISEPQDFAELPPSPTPKREWPSIAVPALVLCLIAIFIAGRYFLRTRAGHLPPSVEISGAAAPARGTDAVRQPARVRRSVAVMGFHNLPGRPEDDWLSTAFSEMLSTELAAGGGLRLLSGEDVARARRDLPPTGGDTLSKSTLERLRANSGADVVVLGAYTPIPSKGRNRIRLDIRLQDTASGETIAEEAVTGSDKDLFELVSRTGSDLRRSLGVSSLSGDDATTARASLPSNQQAVRLYAEGRAKLWEFDFRGARDLLLKAVAADPSYPLSHSALSEAWWHLSYGTKARAEAQRAAELSEHLSQEERLLVEGQYRRTIEDHPKVVEAYQALFNLFPDSLDYGLLLASAQIETNPAASLETLGTLRHLPQPAGEDARIDMVEASAWINVDVVKAEAAARRAIAKARVQGSEVVIARSYGILCQQGPSMPSMAAALNDCENALQGAIAVGDRNAEAIVLTDIAGIHYQQGDLSRAETMWRQANKEFGEAGDTGGVAATLNNLGDARLLQGHLVEARKLLEESIPNYQAVEDKDGAARALNDLGDASRESGDLEGATANYQQAIAIAREIDDNSAIAYVLFGLGNTQMDRGDLAAARKLLEESQVLRGKTGEKQALLETKVALCRVSIEEGHLAETEALLRKYKEQFHQEQQADDELVASVALIQSLLAQGQQAEAKAELEKSGTLAKKSQNPLVRLEYGLASSHVLLVSGRSELCRAQLDKILKEARELGLTRIDLETQLYLAELEGKSGHAELARQQFLSIKKNASAKGYGLISRKAAVCAETHRTAVEE